MRALFSCVPASGHFQPVLPFALDLHRRGHEITFATGSDLRSAILAEGFSYHQVGLGMVEIGRALERRGHDLSPRMQRATFQRYGLTEIRLERALPELLQVIEQVEPDIVVHDLAEYAAASAADVAGLPHATIAFGPRPDEGLVSLAVAGVTPHRRAVGLEPVVDAGLYSYLYFDPIPDCVPIPVPPRVATVRSVQPALGPAVDGGVPELDRRGDRPLVYVTFGTVYGAFSSQVLRAVLDAIEPMELDVIATTGAAPPSEFLPRRPGFVVQRFIPQQPILERASLAVVHGGAGPVFGGLSLGVPLLILPQGADHFDNARAATAAGCAIALESATATVEAIRAAVSELLGEVSFRDSAAQFQREVARMPTISSAGDLLEQLARTASPIRDSA